MQQTNTNILKCDNCQTKKPLKGRAFDGRRAYKCTSCNNIWTNGMQNKDKIYSSQRDGFQFPDSKGVGHVQ